MDDNHLWGRELRLVNNDEYCGKLIELTSSARSSIHFHGKKKETFIVLSGVVTVTYGNHSQDYHAGEQITVLPGQTHSFMLATEPNNIRALILEVSTHHEDSDTNRLEPSVRLPTR